MQKEKVGIVSKNSSTCLEIKDKLCKYLVDTGEFEIFEGTDEQLKKLYLDKILVFGGDGTMLRAAKIGSRINAPVLGVNFGNVGFLAQVESTVTGEELRDLLKSTLTEDRFFLESMFNQTKDYALNEFAIKSSSYRPIITDVYVDGFFADSYHGDGVIISTSTGSTAYSLSAGGPIIDPDLNALIINPVCPHSLHSRPLIINGRTKVKVVVRGEEHANLIADGDLKRAIENGQEVCINHSKRCAKFIAVKEEHSFYNRLLSKMNRWGTTSH